jgi:undecaprenyl-diphosphatase
MSACFFGALAALLTARIQRRRVRIVIWIFATSMFLLIGLSRIYLGVHHTTDVIAGFTAALIWVLMIRLVELQLKRKRITG